MPSSNTEFYHKNGNRKDEFEFWNELSILNFFCFFTASRTEKRTRKKRTRSVRPPRACAKYGKLSICLHLCWHPLHLLEQIKLIFFKLGSRDLPLLSSTPLVGANQANFFFQLGSRDLPSSTLPLLASTPIVGANQADQGRSLYL